MVPAHRSTEHREAARLMVKTNPCICLQAWPERPELVVGRYVICKGIWKLYTWQMAARVSAEGSLYCDPQDP